MTAHPATHDLAALVSARLCHDLISPIGAIGNGLELFELAGNALSPELSLVSDSLATALAKLRFFRLAFGPADAQARLAPDEVAQIAGAMFTSRFTVAWSGTADLPRSLARLAALALLCLEKSLPMGGSVRIADDGAHGLVLAVQARRVAPPADLWAHAETGAPLAGLRSDAVQFALLAQALAETGCRLEARFGETTAELRLAAPALSQPPAAIHP